jgi:hypothetical protein
MTCHSLFGFSVILAGIAFGFLRYPEPCHRLDADAFLERTISVFDLLLGAVAVARASSAWIPYFRADQLGVPIRRALHLGHGNLAHDVQNALHTLAQGIREAQENDAQASPESAHMNISVVYRSAIPELYNVFHCLNQPAPDNFQAAIGWAAVVDSSYTLLLKKGHPAALVVLAYYGLALHALHDTWWLHGVGAELVRSVAAIVRRWHGEAWQELLRWPTEKIEQPLRSEMEANHGLLPPAMLCMPTILTPLEVAFTYTYRNEFAEP